MDKMLKSTLNKTVISLLTLKILLHVIQDLGLTLLYKEFLGLQIF